MYTIKLIYFWIIIIGGHTDISGDVLGNTDVWRVYTCIGHTYIWGCTGGIHGVHIYMGMYRSMGSIQMYGDVQMLGSFNPPKHTDSKTYPHMPANYIYTIFLITFKFNPYRHILLAYQLV